MPIPAKPGAPLSEREREIADMIARGFNTRRIAFELDLCDETVKSHKWRLFRKLGLSGLGASKRLVERMSEVCLGGSPRT